MLIVKMVLKKMLMNYVIRKSILSYLDVNSKKNLSEVNKDFNKIMKEVNYFESLKFKCDNLDEYMKTLELLEVHSKTLKRIIVDNQMDIFSFLPKGIEDKYEVVIRNSRLHITNEVDRMRLNKMRLNNCFIRDKYMYYTDI